MHLLLVAFSPAGKIFSAGLFNRSFHVRIVFFCKPLFKSGECGLGDFGETVSKRTDRTVDYGANSCLCGGVEGSGTLSLAVAYFLPGKIRNQSIKKP